MQAIILAAGVGSRLQPLTDTLPKPMLPVAGQPLLLHTLLWLKRAGVTDVAMNIHHLPEVIPTYFGDGARWELSLRYLYEPELLGTAGAVRRMAAQFQHTFVVVYGDLLLDFDLAALIRWHYTKRALVTIGLKHADDPCSQGMVACDATGKITRFVEKPQHWLHTERTANAGVYVVEPAALEYIPTAIPCDWGHDVFPQLLAADQPVYGQLVQGHVIDIGTLPVYERIKDGDFTRVTAPPDVLVPIHHSTA